VGGAESEVASLWMDGAHSWAIGGLEGQCCDDGGKVALMRTVSLKLSFESIMSFVSLMCVGSVDEKLFSVPIFIAFRPS